MSAGPRTSVSEPYEKQAILDGIREMTRSAKRQIKALDRLIEQYHLY